MIQKDPGFAMLWQLDSEFSGSVVAMTLSTQVFLCHCLELRPLHTQVVISYLVGG